MSVSLALSEVAQFRLAPTLGQLAKSGVWENALSFTRDELPSIAAIEDFISNSKEIAVEAFFEVAFLGVRFRGIEVQSDAAAFIESIVTANSAIEFVETLREKTNRKLPFGTARRVEVGALNAWKSVGPCVLPLVPWDYREVCSSVEASPLQSNSTHMKCLEITFESDVEHWIGMPVSDLKPPYKLSSVYLRHAFELVKKVHPNRTISSER